MATLIIAGQGMAVLHAESLQPYELVLANDSNDIKSHYFPSYFFKLSQVFPHSL